jgi:hypothetical protein
MLDEVPAQVEHGIRRSPAQEEQDIEDAAVRPLPSGKGVNRPN